MANEIVYRTLSNLLEDSINFFNESPNHVSHDSILRNLIKIQKNLQHIKSVAKDYIGPNAHRYDPSPTLQANGYRSLLNLLESLLFRIIQILRSIESERTKAFFRGNEYLDKLEIYSDILHQMRALLYYAQILIDLTPDGELFIDEKQSAPIMHDCEIMAKACFYGSLHGFQYCDSLQPVLHSLSTLVAQYNELHKKSDPWTWFKTAINSSRYVLSPELRGEKLEKIYNGGDVEFFKRFYSLHENAITQVFPNLVGATVKVNRIFKIIPSPFTLPSTIDSAIEVDITCSGSLHQNKVICARLISADLREGQEDPASPSLPDAGFDKSKVVFGSSQVQPKSKHLVFFCHGGGFIALTSKSYEIILRNWSKELECPIFCVDYSLSPQFPFPQAFDECFYAYAWALKNAHFLGTTAERIVFVGDSAGGNLILSVALRAGQCGIRIPDCLVAIYPACIIRYSASPARLMSVMDPLLPLGLLSGCVRSYSGVEKNCIQHPRTDEDRVIEAPVSPSRQPVRIKYISNLMKDVEEGFTRMRSNHLLTHQTWWDKEFNYQHALKVVQKEDNYSTSSEASSHSQSQLPDSDPYLNFKVKLPHDFQPLKSKFCGGNFQTDSSPATKDPFMSPALASDELMKNLPHVDIVGCEYDPLFDDSIVLARRLNKLRKPYRLHVVRGLPHAYLDFQIAKEAKESANYCLGLIMQGLMRTRP